MAPGRDIDDSIDLLSASEESLAAVPRRADSKRSATPDPALGVAAGAATFVLAQAALPAAATTHIDGLTAVVVGAAVSLAPCLAGLKSLCHGPDARKPKLAAGTLGATAGASLGGLIAGATGVGKAGLVLFSLVDGGILLAATLLTGWVATYSVAQVREKSCPGLSGGPRHRGDCSNRICPDCGIFYFPDETARDLSASPDLFLNLRQIYSYLQYQGLDILDSACLLRDNYQAFAKAGITLINQRSQSIEFERDKFDAWARSHARTIAGYRTRGSTHIAEFDRTRFIRAMNRAAE
ncbi:hypothetical protein [Sphingomonas sp. LM7]|uniref:hypothetical protein n=1 Tax=Sphingomonas sp. LM7 TaxID=1938607 RepID=UPI000983CDA6|nr:hypothetical protein [Sphingomonas sp. LM7]AQR73037.1 hypothetical protein BXU08_04530 [Sphingomonas sp. LM7]